LLVARSMQSGGRPRVLVVDDDRALAETVAEGLDDRGFEAVALWSSADAVSRLSTERFDALVTDLRMPMLDGFALLSHARVVAPDMPVIVMTAFGTIEAAVESVRRGAYDYVTKPFKSDELALCLRRALG
jgi:DNA-binding NtrC family response regulator